MRFGLPSLSELYMNMVASPCPSIERIVVGGSGPLHKGCSDSSLNTVRRDMQRRTFQRPWVAMPWNMSRDGGNRRSGLRIRCAFFLLKPPNCTMLPMYTHMSQI